MADKVSNSKFICLTCGRTLENATSICPCGGRATRRARPESEVLNEEKEKIELNWKYRKMAPKVLIAMFAFSFLGILILPIHTILGCILMVITILFTIGYLLAGLYYNCCPFCGRYLYRVLLSDVFCPNCGKRIKPTENHRNVPPAND